MPKTNDTVSTVPTVKMVVEAKSAQTVQSDKSVDVAWINTLGVAISSASWPLAVFLIAFLFRQPIGWLIRQRWNVRYAGMEASIDEEIKDKLSEEPDAKPDASQPSPAFDVADLTERSALDAIVTAWVQVERAIKDYIGARIPNARNIRTGLAPKELIKELSDHDADLLRELRSIRNRVVHEGDSSMTPSSIRLYVDRAVQLSQVITSLAQRPLANDG